MKDKRNVDNILKEWNESSLSGQLDEGHLQPYQITAIGAIAADLLTGRVDQALGTIRGAFINKPVDVDDSVYQSMVKGVSALISKLYKTNNLREDRDNNKITQAGWVYHAGGSGEWDAYKPRDKKKKTYLLIYNDGSWEFYKNGEHDFGRKDPDKKGNLKDDLPDA